MPIEQLESLRSEVRAELLRRRGQTRHCVRCGAAFYAKQNARFCSGRCRVASFREEHAAAEGNR